MLFISRLLRKASKDRPESDHPGLGLLLRKIGAPQRLVPHWLEHGVLESSVAVHLPKLCVLIGAKVTRFEENKITDKSRLFHGSFYPHCLGPPLAKIALLPFSSGYLSDLPAQDGADSDGLPRALRNKAGGDACAAAVQER